MPAPTDAPEVTAEELELAFKPTSRQKALWEAVAATPRDGLSIVGYGGAMGGGKTRALAELAFSTALAFPGTRILVARLRYSDLVSTTMAEFMRRCPPGAILSRRQSPPESVTLHRTDSGQRRAVDHPLPAPDRLERARLAGVRRGVRGRGGRGA